MAYQVLARKWRPQTLEGVMGQDHVTTTLRNAISGDRVAHAYLFTGARGVGKTSSARILAKALNCMTGPTITPCNTCENCEEITAGNSLDVMEIDAASNTGVDNVRELQEGLRYMAAKSRFKIYIIDEVHMLSGSAFNALLKTLEEPPAHVRFIFATTEPHKIPVTILSRCQRFDFKRLSRARIVDQLRHILTAEQVSFTDSALQVLAREAEGSMRDALSLTDQALSFGAGSLDEKSVASALGVIDRQVLSEAVRAILAGEAQTLLELVDQIYDFGYDVRQFTKNLLEHFRNLLVVRVAPDPSRLVDLPIEDVEEMRKQAADVAVDRLHRLFSSLLKLGDDVGRSSQPRMVLEMGLVRLATLGPLQPIEELLGKIRDLANRPPPIAGGLAGSFPAPAATAPAQPPAAQRPAAVPPIHVAPPVPPQQTHPRIPPPAPPAPKNTAVFPSPTSEETTLLLYLRRVNARMAANVQFAEVMNHGDEIVLRFPKEQAFLVTMLKGNAQNEDLHQCVQGFFGRRLPVSVEVGETSNPAIVAPAEPRVVTKLVRESPADRDRKREAVDHPAVQTVMRVFDSGRIMDVHLLKDTLVEAEPDETQDS